MGQSKIRYRTALGRPTAFLFTILVLVNGLAAGTVSAGDEAGDQFTSMFDKKFTVALGGFFPAIDSTFSLGPSGGGSGGDVSLQDDLGFDRWSASLWAGMTWRFLPRHELQLEWFQLNQSADQAAEGTLTIGDTTIFAGASLASKLDLNLGRVTYGYSIFRDEQYDIAFLAGAHIVTTKVSVSASGLLSINGAPPMIATNSESTSTITFPLPHIGGQFTYEFSPRWAMNFRILAFALEINEYRGTLIEVDGTAAYQLSKHFGIGAGIKYFNVNVNAKKTSGAAEFDYQFLGPAIFGYASF